MAISDFLFGQSAEDVKLPPGFTQATARRKKLGDILMAESSGAQETPGEMAARLAGRTASEEASQRARAMAAGARGFGRVAAQLAAQSAAAQAGTRIAADTAARATEARSADVARARGLGAQLLSEQQAAAMAEQELREKMRKGGLLPGLLSVGGTLLGAKLGGAQGAQIGAQAGGGLGSVITNLAR